MAADRNITLVPLSGDLNVQTAPTLRRTFKELLDSGTRRVVLNMADVPYVDSTCMAIIFGMLRTMRAQGGLLSLVNVTPAVMRALKVARFVDMAPVSALGEKREVTELSPSVMPIWRRTLPIDGEHLQVARARIEELASRMPFSSDEVFDLTLAAGEAMGNAADHTCGDGILATVSAYADRMVVEVTDCGEGFDPNAQPREAGASDCGCERGRGIRLMQLLVDAVSIRPRPGGSGTVVRLVKLVS